MQTQHTNKNDLNIQSQHLKTVFQNIHNKNEYKDPQFAHTYDKIYPKQVNITKIDHVIWTPCEQLHHNPYYSNGDFTLKELKQFNFITKKINTALIIMKYFIPQSFNKLAKGRQLYYEHQNKRIKHLFVFDVFLSKQRKKMLIDSYVPVLQVKNRELFVQNRKGCVFGCLVQKLLAKICDGYDNIRRLQVCEMLQMLTGCYVREQRSLKEQQQWINRQIDKKNEINIKNKLDMINKISQYINRKVNVQKSLLFFRTRKNKQLISFGLRPNCLYLIVDISNNNKNDSRIAKQYKNRVITFLQYPCGYQQSTNDIRVITSQQQQQLRWIGKHSRYRLDIKNTIKSMRLKQQQNMRQKYQQRHKELSSDMNFISIKDMLQVSQSLVILHNVSDYHQQNHQYLFSQKRVLPQYLSITTNQGIKHIVNSRKEFQLDQFHNTHLLNIDLGKQHSPLVLVKNKLLYTFSEFLYIKVRRSINTNNEQRATNIINNKNINGNKMLIIINKTIIKVTNINPLQIIYSLTQYGSDMDKIDQLHIQNENLISSSSQKPNFYHQYINQSLNTHQQ